jgi:hypothetical protein
VSNAVVFEGNYHVLTQVAVLRALGFDIVNEYPLLTSLFRLPPEMFDIPNEHLDIITEYAVAAVREQDFVFYKIATSDQLFVSRINFSIDQCIKRPRLNFKDIDNMSLHNNLIFPSLDAWLYNNDVFCSQQYFDLDKSHPDKSQLDESQLDDVEFKLMDGTVLNCLGYRRRQRAKMNNK